MKKVIFALLALTVSASVVSASTIKSNDPTSVVNVIDEKVKISPEELPDAVKAALNSPDFTGWQINAAYKYTESGMYEVELKNGEEMTSIKFVRPARRRFRRTRRQRRAGPAGRA
jgi:hypothetical protein